MRPRHCTYLVHIQSTGDLGDLANYLSGIGLAGAEVIMLDPSPRLQFELNARVLRWVGRHVAVRGPVDVLRIAMTVAGCEKVIVAAEDVRYTREAIAQICDLLELHEVVEPQDYLDPLPWWGGIEAGRILLHRGVEPRPDHGATFGFRRTTVRNLRTLMATDADDDSVRRLVTAGAEVHPAPDVFVKRQPGALQDWLTERVRQAAEDFLLPMKTAFFFSLMPLLLLLALLGGPELAGGYVSVIAFGSMALALRGRAGASAFFPRRAVLFAPVWVFERSVSVYWALLRKLRGTSIDTRTGVEPACANQATRSATQSTSRR